MEEGVDPFRDSLCQLLLIFRLGKLFAFLRAGQEAGLDQARRHLRPACYHKARVASQFPLLGSSTLHRFLMNQESQPPAVTGGVRSIVPRLDSGWLFLFIRILMNAHKGIGAIAVRRLRPLLLRHIGIGFPGQNHPVARFHQLLPKLLCDFQIDVLFQYPACITALIGPSVARIYYNKRMFRVAICGLENCLFLRPALYASFLPCAASIIFACCLQLILCQFSDFRRRQSL